MDFRKLLINAAGILVGGGLMYALVKKAGYEKRAKTIPSVIVEGGAITGAALVGYHLSNLAARHLLQEAPDRLPDEQVHTLPGDNGPVDTPTSETAMGNVNAKAQAVTTPSVTPEEVKGGRVIDISAAKKNEA